MLIISRKKSQKIVVADEIEITILEVGRNRVRFGIKAPRHIPIQTHVKAQEESSVDAAQQTPNSEKAMSAAAAFVRQK